MGTIKLSTRFRYVQCNIKVPEHPGEQFATSPPIFKNTNVCGQDIGPLMQVYADKEGLGAQPWWLLISSFELTNGTIITPLLPFDLELGLICTNFYRFAEYTPVNYLRFLLKSAVNTRHHENKNPNSTILAEILMWLANSSYAIKLWIAVALQLQGVWMMKRHMQRREKKISRDWDLWATNRSTQSWSNLEPNLKNQSL